MPHDDGYFDEHAAAGYDESTAEMFDPAVVDPAVDFLAGLAGSGRALELGIGTGRIALPLARRGTVVHGIDVSNAMVARLRAKPGGDAIGVTIGDFATTSVEGSFSVVYLVFNTIANLTTQEAQVACFRNAAAHLEPGGCFVVEVGVPGLQRLPPGETILPFHVSETRWGFDEYDVATQAMTSHHLRIVDGRAERFSVPFRYVWPSELDLMAEVAGMRRRERWAGWRREPFTGDSRSHVSVWEKPRRSIDCLTSREGSMGIRHVRSSDMPTDRSAIDEPGFTSTVSRVSDPPSGPGGWHHHGDHHVIAYLISGRIRIESGPGGEEVVELEPGDLVHIGAGTVHRETYHGAFASVGFTVGAGQGRIDVAGPDPAG